MLELEFINHKWKYEFYLTKKIGQTKHEDDITLLENINYIQFFYRQNTVR